MTNIKRGLYNTEYGNTCYVSGPSAKYAFDIDSAEKIPLCMVAEYLRPVSKDMLDLIAIMQSSTRYLVLP